MRWLQKSIISVVCITCISCASKPIVDVEISRAVFIDPVGLSDSRLYVNIRNQTDLYGIERKITQETVTLLEEKGYTVTKKPKEAEYYLMAVLLNIIKSPYKMNIGQAFGQTAITTGIGAIIGRSTAGRNVGRSTTIGAGIGLGVGLLTIALAESSRDEFWYGLVEVEITEPIGSYGSEKSSELQIVASTGFYNTTRKINHAHYYATADWNIQRHNTNKETFTGYSTVDTSGNRSNRKQNNNVDLTTNNRPERPNNRPNAGNNGGANTPTVLPSFPDENNTPTTLPSYGEYPSGGAIPSKPNRPNNRPERPNNRPNAGNNGGANTPTVLPSFPDENNTPTTLPSYGEHPSGGAIPSKPNRPNNRPERPNNRPNAGNNGGANTPTVLPSFPDENNTPTILPSYGEHPSGGAIPSKPNRPNNRPERPNNRPNAGNNGTVNNGTINNGNINSGNINSNSTTNNWVHIGNSSNSANINSNNTSNSNNNSNNTVGNNNSGVGGKPAQDIVMEDTYTETIIKNGKKRTRVRMMIRVTGNLKSEEAVRLIEEAISYRLANFF